MRAFINLLSIYLPDRVKSRDWRLWEYRRLWSDCKRLVGFEEWYRYIKMSMRLNKLEVSNEPHKR